MGWLCVGLFALAGVVVIITNIYDYVRREWWAYIREELRVRFGKRDLEFEKTFEFDPTRPGVSSIVLTPDDRYPAQTGASSVATSESDAEPVSSPSREEILRREFEAEQARRDQVDRNHDGVPDYMQIPAFTDRNGDGIDDRYQ